MFYLMARRMARSVRYPGGGGGGFCPEYVFIVCISIPTLYSGVLASNLGMETKFLIEISRGVHLLLLRGISRDNT
jgi:hypothetical protein